MIWRIYTAYQSELTKALRLKFTYAGPALVALAVAAALLAHPIHRDGMSDYAYIAYATPLALNLLGLMLLLVYSASLVSNELGAGTIRLILVRPLRRREFLAAKLLLGMSYALGLSLVAAASSWILAYAFGDLEGVRSGGELVYTASAMRRSFLAAFLLNLAPQTAAVSYALFISTCTRNTAAAVGIAVGVWLLLDTVKYRLHIAPLLFSTYMESSWRAFQDRCDALQSALWPEVQQALLTSAFSTIVLFAFALYIMSRRNLSL